MAFLGARFDLGMVVDCLGETASVWLEEGFCLVICDVCGGGGG